MTILPQISYAQTFFELNTIMHSASPSWIEAIQSVIDRVTACAFDSIPQIVSEISSELENVYTPKLTNILFGRHFTELMGLLAICSAFDMGAVPGSIVALSTTSFSVTKETCVMVGSAGSDLMNVIPIHEQNKGEGRVVHFFREVVENNSVTNNESVILQHLLSSKDNMIKLFDVLLSIDTYDYRKQPPIDPPSTRRVVLEFESPHPYSDNTDHLFEISIKGAKEMVITFDPRTSTETNYDYITFFTDSSQTLRWGEEKYSGTSTSCWPGAGEKPPLKIKTGSCFCLFHSDGSNNGIKNSIS